MKINRARKIHAQCKKGYNILNQRIYNKYNTTDEGSFSDTCNCSIGFNWIGFMFNCIVSYFIIRYRMFLKLFKNRFNQMFYCYVSYFGRIKIKFMKLLKNLFNQMF